MLGLELDLDPELLAELPELEVCVANGFLLVVVFAVAPAPPRAVVVADVCY
jgi:hypothetical protein